jgi:hypothetical protein
MAKPRFPTGDHQAHQTFSPIAVSRNRSALTLQVDPSRAMSVVGSSFPLTTF